MNPSEEKELLEVISECTKGDIIVAAETGKILNDGKYIEVIRTTVYHKPSQKHVTVMYRDVTSGYKKWLRDNINALIASIDKQIARTKEKNSL